MRKMMSLFLLLLLISGSMRAQVTDVTGKILDENGRPVAFATVALRDSKEAVSADQEGNFKITAKSGSVLLISAAGFESVTLPVGKKYGRFCYT